MTDSKNQTIVIDSSCWIEILRQGPLVRACEKELKNAARVLVPTVVFYEVYKKVSSAASEDRGLSAVARMSQYEIVDLTRDVALTAADLSSTEKLHMADSLVLAHALHENAILVTLDNDFANVARAKVLR